MMTTKSMIIWFDNLFSTSSVHLAHSMGKGKGRKTTPGQWYFIVFYWAFYCGHNIRPHQNKLMVKSYNSWDFFCRFSIKLSASAFPWSIQIHWLNDKLIRYSHLTTCRRSRCRRLVRFPTQPSAFARANAALDGANTVTGFTCYVNSTYEQSWLK